MKDKRISLNLNEINIAPIVIVFFFFFFLKLNASLHYNQRDGSFSKCMHVSFLLLGILQRAPPPPQSLP